MFDINKITEVGKVSIEKLIVYSPEQCPFRVYAFDKYGNDQEVCGLCLNRGDEDASCYCIDKVWIVGCPLLKDSFTIEKN